MTEQPRTFTVQPAAETGFIITACGVIVAAFSSGAEACAWIERQYRPHDAQAGDQGDETSPIMPRVVSSRDSTPDAAAPARRTGVHRLFGG